VIHDDMPYDPIQGQGQGHRGRTPKCAKLADFYAISSADKHVIKRLTVNYDNPRQYLRTVLSKTTYEPRVSLRNIYFHSLDNSHSV